MSLLQDTSTTGLTKLLKKEIKKELKAWACEAVCASLITERKTLAGNIGKLIVSKIGGQSLRGVIEQAAAGLICPECSSDLKAESCPSCGWSLSLVNGIPQFFSGNSEADAAYKNNYEKIASADLGASIVPEDYLRKLAENFVSHLPLRKNFMVCDVGCGKGFVLDAIKRRGIVNLSAVDIVPAYMENMKNSYRCYLANAENLPFKNSYDLIIASDILEHVFNPANFLDSAWRALRPGGFLALKTPFNENIAQYSRKNGCPYKFVHLRTFTRKNLGKMLRSAGFCVRNFFYDGYRTYSDVSRFSSRPRRVLDRWLFHMLLPQPETNFVLAGQKGSLRARLLSEPVEIGVIAQKPYFNPDALGRK